MLMLVLAGNLFHLFVGWELVGLCSYKLIGFWSEKQDPCNAARKAFITTRIGDLGMVAALMILYRAVGSLEFDKVFAAATSGSLSTQAMTWSSLGLFAAAIGERAVPLHVAARRDGGPDAGVSALSTRPDGRGRGLPRRALLSPVHAAARGRRGRGHGARSSRADRGRADASRRCRILDREPLGFMFRAWLRRPHAGPST
jgi:GNAT superfamily N-acetyltransferase